MNKRAEEIFDVAGKTIYWIIAAVVLAMLILSFLFTLSSFKSKRVQPPLPLQAEFIAARFWSSPACFALHDTPTTIIPSTIDLARFTNSHLQFCYQPNSEQGYTAFNFRLELQRLNQTIFTNNYFYQDDYVFTKTVLVKDGEQWLQDELKVYVQQDI